MKKYSLVIIIALALIPATFAMSVAAEEALRETLFEVSGFHELVRELDFTVDVGVEISGDETLTGYADKIAMAHGETSDGLESLEKAWKSLGMLPEEIDLRKILRELRSMQTRSVYEREGNRILISGNRATPGWNTPLISRTMQQLNVEELEFVLGLQLAYALHDQNFETASYWDDSMSLDRRLATRAVVDGAAVALGCEYLLHNTGINMLLLPNAEAIIEQFMPLVTYIDKSRFESLPRLLQSYISFPYLKGVDFTLFQKKAGGNKLADAAFRSLPLGTEQLMHPEKYYEKRDNPIKISLADLSAEFGARATMV
ncbi:MAG: hypothetical protein KAG97_11305, partial [Victivallales bacterium]|nr:hypothetical protein [Victivallales bacterium]